MKREELPRIGLEILGFVKNNKNLKDFKKIAHNFIDTKALDDLSELEKLKDVHFYELTDEEINNKIYSSNIKEMILIKARVIEETGPCMKEQDIPSVESLERRSSFNKLDITYSTKAYEFE